MIKWSTSRSVTNLNIAVTDLILNQGSSPLEFVSLQDYSREIIKSATFLRLKFSVSSKRRLFKTINFQIYQEGDFSDSEM